MWLALGEPARTPALHKSRSSCTALIFTLPTWALLATVRFFTQTMLPKRLLALTLFVALAVMPPCVLRAQWVRTNGPYGGEITCFAVSGSSLFAGTNGGGLFLSTNNGGSWVAVNNGIAENDISALAVSGTNIYAAGGGVSHSTNNGASWTTTFPEQPDTASLSFHFAGGKWHEFICGFPIRGHLSLDR